MTGILLPYISWDAVDGNLNLWGLAGFHWGEVEIDDEVVGSETTDANIVMAAFGGSSQLYTSEQLIAGGETKLRFKGQGRLPTVKSKGTD